LVSERQNVELRVESQESGVLFLRQPESTVITGTTLTAGTVTFSWNAVKGAKDYWIDVGTSPSKGDIRGAYTGGNTSITVDIKRHLNGNPIYVQLYADTGAPMVPGTGLKAQFATATPAAQQATLTAGSVTFTWNAVKGAKDYWLDVGTVASKGNLWAGFTGGKTAVTVDLRNHLNGAPIYVQFFADTGAPMVPGAGVHFAFGTASQ
jgi:hypothetical protein